jgi:hypothetical protein
MQILTPAENTCYRTGVSAVYADCFRAALNLLSESNNPDI